MDIDRQAVYVAAFSLYLALLELDPDPQPPDALRLPRLLVSEHSNERGKIFIFKISSTLNPSLIVTHRLWIEGLIS